MGHRHENYSMGNIINNYVCMGLIPGLGRSPGGGNGNPLQHSCLQDPMNRGAWQATVHGITETWTLLSD